MANKDDTAEKLRLLTIGASARASTHELLLEILFGYAWAGLSDAQLAEAERAILRVSRKAYAAPGTDPQYLEGDDAMQQLREGQAMIEHFLEKATDRARAMREQRAALDREE